MRILRTIRNNLRRIQRGEFTFHLERRICATLNCLLGHRPVSTPFLSGDTYRSFCDLEICEIDDIRNMKEGDIIFLSAEKLNFFRDIVLPRIHTTFLMITHHGDQSITSDYLGVANHPKLIHWFAQNNKLKHPKITAIPIGLEDAWRHNNGIVNDFIKLRKKRENKTPRILYGFNVNTNKSVRSKAKEELSKCVLADWIDVDSRTYRKILNQYMFVASPEGNGIDCHRTWEALYLESIPIVTGKHFYSQFNEFPGLILNSWDELSMLDEKKLIKIYGEKIALLDKTPYIWENYWKNIIKKS